MSAPEQQISCIHIPQFEHFRWVCVCYIILLCIETCAHVSWCVCVAPGPSLAGPVAKAGAIFPVARGICLPGPFAGQSGVSPDRPAWPGSPQGHAAQLGVSPGRGVACTVWAVSAFNTPVGAGHPCLALGPDRAPPKGGACDKQGASAASGIKCVCVCVWVCVCVCVPLSVCVCGPTVRRMRSLRQ